MKTAFAAVLALTIPAAAFACDQEMNAKAAIQKVTVAEVQSLTKEKKATAVDANGKETRAKYGTIPGALLLTSAKFEPSKELPTAKDASLVFYCANTMCSAAEKAAKRAVEAGYTKVAVMPDGIMGWKDSGAPVAMPRS